MLVYQIAYIYDEQFEEILHNAKNIVTAEK